MKKHDLQPTDENIRETFRNDSIGRNADLVNFIKIIDSIEESYSIALDSYWGSGKTFFVKQVKMILDVNNKFTYDSVKDKEVKDKWKELLKDDIINENYHIPIYYDAWANDNDNDPILSIVYQILQTIGNQGSIEEGTGLTELLSTASSIFEAVKGFNPIESAKKLKGNNPLEEIMQAKSLQDNINDFIDRLIPEHGERLLIIIDELDRCNPEFAVKLLERIKHYFNNDRVTFLFSVNLVELQHTIKNHYGSDFDASRYLDRFFDLHVTLPPADMNKFLESQGLYDNNYVFDDSMKLIIKKYNLQLREITKYITISKYIVANQAYVDSYTMRDGIKVILHVVVPIITALKITNLEKYTDFVSGRDSSPLLDFYNDKESIENVNYFLSLIFTQDEAMIFSSSDAILQEKDHLHDILKSFYNGLFKNGNVGIGKCYINDTDREYFRKIISLLSPNTMECIKSEESSKPEPALR